MAFSVFNSLATKILQPVTSAVDVAGTVVTWVVPIFLLGITIQLLMYGIDVIRGAGGNQYFLDALAKVARPFLVLNLALAAGMYTGTVVPFFAELRTELSSLYGQKGANSYAIIDYAMENVLSTLSYLVPYVDSKISFIDADFSGIIMYACMGIVILAMLFYCALASINLMIIDASLAIVIGLGPLFIACFAWQATAKFFDSWLSTMLKYVFSAALIAMVIGLANGLISKFALGVKASGDSFDFISLAATTVASAAVLVALLVKVPAIAAELVGGIGVQLAGPMAAARALMSGGGAAAGVAGGAARAGSFAAGAASGPAGRAAAAAANTPLGARVLKATESMRAQASSAASTTTTAARNFGNAVSGVAADGTKGHGAANAFRMGRQTTSGSSGTGTINGAGNGVRPVPKAEWRD